MLLEKHGMILLQVKVVPNAGRTQIAGPLGAALKVKIAQPPEDGRANRALIALLAEVLQIAPAQIDLVAGHTRPQKTLRLTGISLAQARQRLDHAGASAKKQ